MFCAGRASGADYGLKTPVFKFTPDFAVDGVYYSIIDDGVAVTREEGTVENTLSYNVETFTVPSSVVHEGVTYPVVSIVDGTFHKDRTLKKIVLPEGFRRIGQYAFDQSEITEINFPTTLKVIAPHAFRLCYGLTSITIPDDVASLSIGEDAFAGCKNISIFRIGRGVKRMGENSLGTCNWYEYGNGNGSGYISMPVMLDRLYSPFEVPPSGFGPLFNSWLYDGGPYYLYIDCVLHVPVGSAELYKKAENWKDFIRIVEDPELSSIKDVMTGEGSIRAEAGRIVGEGVLEVYDFGGRMIARGRAEELPVFPAGFYIVRNATSTAKVAIR